MTFTRKSADLIPIVDTVFAVVQLAKEDKEKNGPENVVDATIGALYGEDGKLVAFESVFDNYDKIPHTVKAAYASSFIGNEGFRKEVYSWLFDNINSNLKYEVIATPGGSGAVALTFQSILEENQTVIIPDIAWGSYKLMASQNNLKSVTYSMFNNNKFNIDSFKETILDVSKTQDKILVVINDPCHNPTGYTMSKEEWIEIINFLNEVSKEVPCVILNDVAYIDYSYDLDNSRNYLELFNNISDGLMVILAFSISKSLTSYGLRCGAAIPLATKQESVDQVRIVFEKGARATWSNIPNAAMENFTWVVSENKENFLKEKQHYIDLIKKRSSIFIEEAKEVNLSHYPYMEGFFVTLNMPSNEIRDKYHQKLMDNHIYTVCVNKGIRVAMCSLSVDKTYGLAKKMKEIYKSI